MIGEYPKFYLMKFLENWGPYDIDIFACDYNAKVENFVQDFGILFRLQWMPLP